MPMSRPAARSLLFLAASITWVSATASLNLRDLVIQLLRR